MLTSIIVDDEQKARSNLQNLLELCDVEVSVLKEFDRASDAVIWLKTAEVDCIFLDIEMPEMDGFQFLDTIDAQKTKIIFVTAYGQYSIRALRANAIDYLLKPVDIDELETALQRLILSKSKSDIDGSENRVYEDSLKNLLRSYGSGKLNSKITIPQTHGFKIVDSNEIIRVSADGSYSSISLLDNQSELVTKNIGHFEEILDESKFVRIHNSHLINLDHMTEFSTEDGGTVKLKDGSVITIARRRLKPFKDKIDAFYS